MEVKFITELNNYENNELSPYNKQILNAHATIHCYVILIQIGDKSELHTLWINNQY
jgi:hypothetical protein